MSFPVNLEIGANRVRRVVAVCTAACFLLCVSGAFAQTAARPDADIETDVTAALAQSQQLQGQSITAATIEGDVTLSGTVRDASSKQLAGEIAAQVSGVRSVENNLAVSSASAQSSSQGPGQTSGEQIPPPPPYDQGVSRPGENYPPQQQESPTYPRQRSQPEPAYQQPSGPVTVPAGTLLNVRASEPIDSRRAQVGATFQATVADDIYEGGALAIPRGAVLTGQVTGVRKAGDLAGKSGLQLQITALNLGGQAYALTTDPWTGEAPGKGGYSAANTAGGTALGAIIGAIAGGGPGAAIGAVAGGVTGLAASAASKGPQIVIPPEAVLRFHLAAPVTVTPVSYQEAQRLQASVTPRRPELRRRRVYAYPYPWPYYGYPYPYYYRPGYYYYSR